MLESRKEDRHVLKPAKIHSKLHIGPCGARFRDLSMISPTRCQLSWYGSFLYDGSTVQDCYLKDTFLLIVSQCFDIDRLLCDELTFWFKRFCHDRKLELIVYSSSSAESTAVTMTWRIPKTPTAASPSRVPKELDMRWCGIESGESAEMMARCRWANGPWFYSVKIR